MNNYQTMQMTNSDSELYFEISDTGNLVRLEPLELINYNSDIDWDKNWVRTKVVVVGGAFSGEYIAEMKTIDFEVFKQELKPLYENLHGSATFLDIERFLELKIQGDGLGHFEVKVTANDQPGINESKLIFNMSFDQTFLKGFINQLNEIITKFSIVGDDFEIKNK